MYLGNGLSGDTATLTAATQSLKCKDELHAEGLENTIMGLSAKYFAGEMPFEQGSREE